MKSISGHLDSTRGHDKVTICCDCLLYEQTFVWLNACNMLWEWSLGYCIGVDQENEWLILRELLTELYEMPNVVLWQGAYDWLTSGCVTINGLTHM